MMKARNVSTEIRKVKEKEKRERTRGREEKTRERIREEITEEMTNLKEREGPKAKSTETCTEKATVSLRRSQTSGKHFHDMMEKAEKSREEA